MSKLRVGLVFGGKSAEHEVSLLSAKSIYENLNPNQYEVVLIGVDKLGKWQLCDKSSFLRNAENPKSISLVTQGVTLSLAPGEHQVFNSSDAKNNSASKIDVIFSVIHGNLGEDGSLQGLLNVAELPYVGPGVLCSAIGMDKDVSKRLLRDAGIRVANFVAIHRHDSQLHSYSSLSKSLGSTLFVKPANTGSSVGISKVKNQEEFQSALALAFKYDNKILIEESIEGREIEISVMGNEEPLASCPGEVISHHDFYSYEAKYLDPNGASFNIPAQLPTEITNEIIKLAKLTYQTLCCEGLARVDFFLKKDNTPIVNEINTLPGFTKISMYPKMWEASGVSYSQLLDRLIQYALNRHGRNQKLQHNFSQSN